MNDDANHTDAVEPAFFRHWCERFLTDIESRQDELTELDRRTGDGDFGMNMATAAAKAHAHLGTGPTHGASAFKAVASGFLATGGTSGPLFGIWFQTCANALEEGLSLRNLAHGVRSGTDAVQRLGHATVGDRTMVDAMLPAAEALHTATSTPLPFGAALEAAAEAAEQGAASTEKMIARRGRSSYLGETVLGARDPGALVVAIFFRAGADAWEQLPM